MKHPVRSLRWCVASWKGMGLLATGLSMPRRQGTWGVGLFAPVLAQAFIFCVCVQNHWRSSWNKKENATLYAHCSLGSRQRERIARMSAVPNPLPDLKPSSTGLPNSLVEPGLWGSVGRGGGWSLGCTAQVLLQKAAPLPQAPISSAAGESDFAGELAVWYAIWLWLCKYRAV